MAADPRVSAAEVMSELPSVDEIIATTTVQPVSADEGGSLQCTFHTSHYAFNSFMACAAAAEKLGCYDEALRYALAGLVPDLAKAGTSLVYTRVVLLSIQGRALAALGQASTAGPILEAAADEAHRNGLWLYESFALLDLKLLVLDAMGHEEFASRQLGVALRQLTGPAEKLKPLLQGLDAAKLIALPPPEAGYKVVYEDNAVVALRKELQDLRLKELRKRAKDDGVPEDELDDAVDSDDPKTAVIAVLLAHASAASKETQELRSQLEGLRLKDLRKRTKQANLDQDEVDDATDSDNPRAALVELLVRHAAATDRLACATDLPSR